MSYNIGYKYFQKKEDSYMNTKCYRSELVGLFGDPVDENATIMIMEAAFKALGLNWRYMITRVKPDDLETAVKALKAFNMQGTHVTTPHKVTIIPYLDHIAGDASIMGAVNTVYLRDGETYGENTDGKGFITSLKDENIELNNKNIVMFGAGGAARAMSVELALAGANHIWIVNRNEKRGSDLVDLLREKTKVNADYANLNYDYCIPEDTDLVINATSIGMYPDPNKVEINYNSLSKNMIVCDGVHNPQITPFLQEAKKHGCRIIDGLSMLVNQGVISFEMWTGLKAPVEVMKEALAKEFGL